MMERTSGLCCAAPGKRQTEPAPNPFGTELGPGLHGDGQVVRPRRAPDTRIDAGLTVACGRAIRLSGRGASTPTRTPRSLDRSVMRPLCGHSCSLKVGAPRFSGVDAVVGAGNVDIFRRMGCYPEPFRFRVE